MGVGLGGVPVAFTLFAEFCPAGDRGAWLVALQSFWTAGTMAEALLAWCILLPWGWRWLLGLSALPTGAPGTIPLQCSILVTLLRVRAFPFFCAGVVPLYPTTLNVATMQNGQAFLYVRGRVMAFIS